MATCCDVSGGGAGHSHRRSGGGRCAGRDNGFTASVTVTNNGTAAIDGWTLRWPFTDGQQVGNGWNATVTQNGQAVSAVNANWNARIEPGASVTFGFLAARAGPNSTPAAFTLNDSNCR